MADPREGADSSADEIQNAAFARMVEVAEKIEITPYEELVRPEVAARLGLEYAEAYHAYGMFLKRPIHRSTIPNLSEARNLSMERQQGFTEAILDARRGQFAFLKGILVDLGLVDTKLGIQEELGVKLVIVGLAIPDEVHPSDLTPV